MPAHGSTVIPRDDIRGAFLETAPLRRLVALEIFPPVDVNAPTGRFGRVATEALIQRVRSIERNPGGGYARLDWVIKDEPFQTQEYGDEEVLDDRDENVYAEAFDLATVRALRCLGVYLRHREMRAAALCINPTTFPLSGNTGMTAATPWTSASATPIADVQTGLAGIRARCGLTADTLVIPWRTQYDLSRVTEVRSSRMYAEPVDGAFLPGELARILGVQRVLVADELYDAGDEGVSVTPTEVWSPLYAFLCVTARTMDIQEPCIGRTFLYHEDGSSGPEPTVEEYRQDDIRSSVLRVRGEEQQKLIHAACGYLFKIS